MSSRIGPFHFNHPVCYYIPSYNFMSCKNRYFVNEELLKCSNLCTSIEFVIICPEDPENWFLTLFFHKTIYTFIVFFDSDYSILLWWTFRFFRSYHHSLLCRLEKPFSNIFLCEIHICHACFPIWKSPARCWNRVHKVLPTTTQVRSPKWPHTYHIVLVQKENKKITFLCTIR